MRTYRAIVSTLDQGHSITLAAKWLVDNDHLVEEQFHQIQEDLPPRLYRHLSQLVDGPFDGYPRVFAGYSCVFGIAWSSTRNIAIQLHKYYCAIASHFLKQRPTSANAVPSIWQAEEQARRASERPAPR